MVTLKTQQNLVFFQVCSGFFMYIKSLLISFILLSLGQVLHAMEFESLDDACNKSYVSVGGKENFKDWHHLRELILALAAKNESEQERFCCCFPWKKHIEVLDMLADIQSDIDHHGFPSLARDWLMAHRDDLQKQQRSFCCCNKICLGGCGGLSVGLGSLFLVPDVAASSVVLGGTVCGMCIGACTSYARIKNPTLERMLIVKPRRYLMPYVVLDDKSALSVKANEANV